MNFIAIFTEVARGLGVRSILHFIRHVSIVHKFPEWSVTPVMRISLFLIMWLMFVQVHRKCNSSGCHISRFLLVSFTIVWDSHWCTASRFCQVLHCFTDTVVTLSKCWGGQQQEGMAIDTFHAWSTEGFARGHVKEKILESAGPACQEWDSWVLGWTTNMF